MKYYIDCNNFGYHLFNSEKDSDIREKTLNYILRSKIPKMTTIVFDGFPFCSENKNGQLIVIFSRNKSADEVIVNKISKGDVVVTNDRALQERCKLKGAKVLDSSAFISKIEIKIEKSEKPEQEKNVDMWIKEFGAKDDNE